MHGLQQHDLLALKSLHNLIDGEAGLPLLLRVLGKRGQETTHVAAEYRS
jgi:hypothetical protein